MEAMKLMVEGEDGDKIKIFREYLHSIWENYFSGYQIMDWLGGDGFGATVVCRRDQLPG